MTAPSGYGYEPLPGKAENIFHWDQYASSGANDPVDKITLWGPNNNYGWGNPAEAQLYVPSLLPNAAVTFRTGPA